MKNKILSVIILLLLSGCQYWYNPSVKLENAKKDYKLSAQTDDPEYSMFLKGYKKVEPPKEARKDWLLIGLKIVPVAGE